MTTEPERPFRDAALDAAWRAQSADEPPAHLDAAILAAAHDAVSERRRDVRKPSSRAAHSRRWWMPLAAAAMVSGVVIGVSRLAPQDQAATAPHEIDLPERGAAAYPNAGAPLQARSASPAPPRAPSPSLAFVPSPAESGDTTAPRAIERGEIAASESTRAEPSPKAESTFAPEPPAAARANTQSAATLDADARVARIHELFREGKLAEAEQELVALRTEVPDADRRLPSELEEWAKTIQP